MLVAFQKPPAIWRLPITCDSLENKTALPTSTTILVYVMLLLEIMREEFFR